MRARQKTLAVTVISLALMSFTQPSFSAAPKAGATCTKAGVTATANGLKFTCVKSGKKFVWNKGVKVITATPTATPTSTPTATPTATPTPKPSETSTGQIQPNGKCTVEGAKEPLNGGQMICQNGTWQPFNAGAAGGTTGGSTSTTSAPATTVWGYLSSITSGNGLGNISDASLVQEPGGKIRMYFKNGNDSDARLTGFDNYIHSAVSTDSGLTWTVESGVRMAVTSPVEVLSKAGGGYQAWGWAHAPGGDSMYYAESTDGLTFTQIAVSGLDISTCKTTAGTNIGPLGDPAIVHLPDGTWLLHAQGYGVGNTGPEFARWACVATSSDGKTWTAAQARSYGGTTDVTTNPNIYLNKDGKVEWDWPTSLGIMAKIGDGTTYGAAAQYIKAGDPDRLDLANGTELMAFGGFDSRTGGVIFIAKKYTNSYTITRDRGNPPDPLGPDVNTVWTVAGSSQSQINVFNFCLNKSVKDITGATVTYETTGATVKVTARDPNSKHNCFGVLVGTEKIIG
ncbi:MAG: hypothetical protein WCJ16_07875 [Actinomycetes bacterium]